MPDVDKEFVREKIQLAGKYLEEIGSFLKESDDVLRTDLKSRYALERVFLLLVEEMIDVNNHFLRALAAEPVEDLKSSFTALGDAGVLPPDFAKKIAPLVGVRNILVHQYEKIDFELFLKNLRANIGDFDRYLGAIVGFLAGGAPKEGGE